MKILSDNRREYEVSLEPSHKERLIVRIQKRVRIRRFFCAGALVLPLAAWVSIASLSTPDSVFEPQANTQDPGLLIGAISEGTPTPDTRIDGKKPWYELSEKEKILITRDSIRSRYGLRIDIPRGCRADYVANGRFWMPNESMAGGWTPCFYTELAVTSHTKECIFLFDHTYAYNPHRIAINRKNGNKFPMRRELLWVFRGIHKPGIRSKKDFPADFNYMDYLSELPASPFGADTVYTYEVPPGRTAFCFNYPGDTAEPLKCPVSPLEVLHQERYPVLRRYFFIKNGHITYSAMAMMTERAAKHRARYERLLNRIIRYDPTVQYEDEKK